MTDQSCPTDCPACADGDNISMRRAVAVLERYIVDKGYDGTFADKIACIGSILDAVNEGQMPDQGGEE